MIEEHRLMRRKFGLAYDGASEFHIMIRTHDLVQLDAAFNLASTQVSEFEQLHKAVYSAVASAKFELYRNLSDILKRATS